MAWTTDKAEHARRLEICKVCPHVIMTVRGACVDCGRVQKVTGSAKTGWPCSSCGGAVHPRKGKKLDYERPRCGYCGCALAARVYSSCPLPGKQRKW